MPVTRIPKPSIAASDAELERQYISSEGWQTVEVEDSPGGCQYITTCEDDQFIIEVKSAYIVAQEVADQAGSEIYCVAQDKLNFQERAGLYGTYDGVDHSHAQVGAMTVGDASRAAWDFDAIDGSPTQAQLTAGKLSFDGGISPITRPELSLASPTLAADVAQALADLGLITLV